MKKQVKELVERVGLTPEEIGDNLELEEEAQYPMSTGGTILEDRRSGEVGDREIGGHHT